MGNAPCCSNEGERQDEVVQKDASQIERQMSTPKATNHGRNDDQLDGRYLANGLNQTT